LAQELLATGCRPLYCWQSRTAKVEFLLEQGASIIPLEVKSGMVAKAKSLTVYQDK